MSHTNTVLMVLTYVAFIIIFESLAQSSFKVCHANGNKVGFFFGTLFYGIVGIFLIKSYEYKSMASVNILWSALSVASSMLIGHYYWGEKITNNDIIGSIMVFMGIVLVMMDDDDN